MEKKKRPDPIWANFRQLSKGQNKHSFLEGELIYKGKDSVNIQNKTVSAPPAPVQLLSLSTRDLQLASSAPQAPVQLPSSGAVGFAQPDFNNKLPPLTSEREKWPLNEPIPILPARNSNYKYTPLSTISN